MAVATEHEEQKAFCQFLDLRHIKYFAVPNGFYTSEKNKAKKFGLLAKFKAEGVKKGVPDIVVFLEDYILFVEMKRTKGGIISKEQKEWICFLNTLPYAKAKVCKGYTEAVDFIKQKAD